MNTIEALKQFRQVVAIEVGPSMACIELCDGTEIRATGLTRPDYHEQLVDFVDAYVSGATYDKKLSFKLRII